MNLLEKKRGKRKFHQSISLILVLSLMFTLIAPSFQSFRLEVNAQDHTIGDPSDFTVRTNSEEIKDIELLLSNEKPYWESKTYTKNSLKTQAIHEAQIFFEYEAFPTLGGGGDYLKTIETEIEAFSPKGKTNQSVTLTWEDTLQDWIKAQEREKYKAKNPVPTGYKAAIFIKEKFTKKIYQIREEAENIYGENTFLWDGKDIAGKVVPDGIYEWYLKVPVTTIIFEKTETRKVAASPFHTRTSNRKRVFLLFNFLN